MERIVRDEAASPGPGDFERDLAGELALVCEVTSRHSMVDRQMLVTVDEPTDRRQVPIRTNSVGEFSLSVRQGSTVSACLVDVFPPGVLKPVLDLAGGERWVVVDERKKSLVLRDDGLNGFKFLIDGEFRRDSYAIAYCSDWAGRQATSPLIDRDELRQRGVDRVAVYSRVLGRIECDLSTNPVDHEGDLLLSTVDPGAILIESGSGTCGGWSASVFPSSLRIGRLPGMGVRGMEGAGTWEFRAVQPGDYRVEFWRDGDKWRTRHVLTNTVRVVSGLTAHVTYEPMEVPPTRLRVNNWSSLGEHRQPRMVTVGAATFPIDRSSGCAEVRVFSRERPVSAAPTVSFSFGNRVGGLLPEVATSWHEGANELQVLLDLDSASCRLGLLSILGGRVGVEVLQQTPMDPSSWTGIGVVADEDGLFRVVDGPEALPVVLFESDPKTQRRHVRGWLDVRGRRGVHWLAPAGRWLALVVGAPLEAEVHVLGPIGVPTPDQVLPSFGLPVQNGVSLWLPNEARGIRVAYSSGSWIDVPAASLGSAFVVSAVAGR